jgi:hypothetical protein
MNTFKFVLVRYASGTNMDERDAHLKDVHTSATLTYCGRRQKYCGWYLRSVSSEVTP